MEVGDRIINEHDEKDEHEELYLVHSGRARFEIGGETVDAPVGTLVYAKPGVLRTAFAEEPNTILIAMGGEPGKPYQAGGYEIWAPIDPLYKAGRYEEAAALGKQAADEYPQYSMVVYNIACCEAHGRPRGRRDRAPRALRSRGTRTSRSGPPGTPTSSRSGRTRASRSSSPRSTAR